MASSWTATLAAAMESVSSPPPRTRRRRSGASLDDGLSRSYRYLARLP